MGKRLKMQRRGKGSNAYTKLPNTFDIDVSYTSDRKNVMIGEVVDIFNHTGHTAPLMELLYGDFSKGYLIAPEGIKVGDKIHINGSLLELGTVAELSQIPFGTPIYNVEASPGDGGKYIRSAGSSGILVSHEGDFATVQLPSKTSIVIRSACRAQLGIVAGGGMSEAPLVKAGKNFYINHAINKLWPRYRGVKSNPVDHPFGGKQHHKGKSSMTSRNAPPGRKVGHIAARRVGRKKKG
jgi:large subunit ribosomal protein L2